MVAGCPTSVIARASGDRRTRGALGSVGGVWLQPAEAVGEALEDRVADRRHLVHQGMELAMAEDEEAAGLGCRDRRRPPALGQQSHLAEPAAGASLAEFTTVAVDQSSADRRGQSLAQFQLFYDLGIGIGSLTLGALLDLVDQDFSIMYLTTAIVAMIGLCLSWKK